MRILSTHLSITIVLITILAVCYGGIPTNARIVGKEPKLTSAQTPQSLRDAERDIENRERNRKGITVDKVRVYDDAMLQQMLQAAEARLASLQLIDQAQILSRLGAVSGASQQVSGIGVNVQGAPIPGVVTTTKLPTQTTTEATAAGAASSSVSTVSGLATEDVQTTRPQFNPPASTAPAPTTTLPSAGFSVASSDILNEQMQLTAEINGLRLMLAGDLSGHFISSSSGFGEGVAKFKTTLGFPITISPDERYKDAEAVVEVEVNTQPNPFRKPTEKAMITTLLPREKTYNVATISDRSVSIGGGVATQILGFSGSWVRGHKTYYLVQDQDTIAKAFTPRDPGKIGFAWEFRPVLGQRYVRGGLKQTFVQLAFEVPANAGENEVGGITVRTYWRRYDRKRGLAKEIIEGSLTPDTHFEIPTFSLSAHPALTSSNIEDIGSGQLLIRLTDRFLPGTYVRVGSKIISTSSGLLHEYGAIRFTVPIADVALRDSYLVAHTGREVPLTLSSCGATDEVLPNGGTLPLVTRYIPTGNPDITALDEANSLVRVSFVKEETRGRVITTSPLTDVVPGLVVVIGQRVFGYSQVKQEPGRLTVVVPAAILNPRTELSIQTVFPGPGCPSDPVVIGAYLPSRPERLVVLQRGSATTTFLLYGEKLNTLHVISPSGARLSDIAGTDPAKLRVLTLTAANLASNKQVLFLRPGEKPFLVTIPELEPKKPEAPKALESVTVGADEVFIVGDGLADTETVTFRGDPIEFEVVDKNTLRLSKLKSAGITKSASTQTVVLQSKTGAKIKVAIKIVDSKVQLESN